MAIVGNGERLYHGGAIYYQVEAHVRYGTNGVPQDAWAPASKISDDKLFLEFWLAQRSKTSGVVWENPRNPADRVVVLD